jgi:hypothetical protein
MAYAISMDVTEQPKTFAELHLLPGPRVEDCIMLRARIGEYLRQMPDDVLRGFLPALSAQTGTYLYDAGVVVKYLKECTLVRFLVVITEIAKLLPESVRVTTGYNGYSSTYRNTDPKKGWIDNAAKAFEQQNVAYKVLPNGSVTYLIDSAFDEVREAAVSLLGHERYAAARKHVDEAMVAMSKPGSERQAIRGVFDALENVFKLEFGEGILGTSELKKYEQKLAAGSGDDAERTAKAKMITSFSHWIGACHQYRHAAGGTEVALPDRVTTVWIVHSGLAHLRWLIEAVAQRDTKTDKQ